MLYPEPINARRLLQRVFACEPVQGTHLNPLTVGYANTLCSSPPHVGERRVLARERAECGSRLPELRPGLGDVEDAVMPEDVAHRAQEIRILGEAEEAALGGCGDDRGLLGQPRRADLGERLHRREPDGQTLALCPPVPEG